jgi:hypothetical protein
LRGQVKQMLNLSPVPLVTEMTKQYTRFWKGILTPGKTRPKPEGNDGSADESAKAEQGK